MLKKHIPMTKQKVVLAYSGGLDTSFCAKYLSDEKEYEVYTVLVNTGNYHSEELEKIAEKAYMLGVTKHHVVDISEEYYQNCIRFMIFGNMLKNNEYPYSISSERVFQAIGVIRYAKEIGAKNIAHGSTGAGNDQVRFDLVIGIIAPDIQILTPIRDLKLTREQEIQYLISKGIKANWDNYKYSITRGLWGTYISGKETRTSINPLPEEAYSEISKQLVDENVEFTFERGELIKVNGKVFDNKIEAIRYVDSLGSKYGIGRDMYTGDTIIGIKGRVGFEAPAATLIVHAHRALEQHTLSKWQIYWKEQLSDWYSMFIHEAQFLDPVMRNIEKLIEDTQNTVNGSVFVCLKPYIFQITGVKSKNDLMNPKFGIYGEKNLASTIEDIHGFTNVTANSLKIFYTVNKEILQQITKLK